MMMNWNWRDTELPPYKKKNLQQNADRSFPEPKVTVSNGFPKTVQKNQKNWKVDLFHLQSTETLSVKTWKIVKSKQLNISQLQALKLLFISIYLIMI